MSDSYVLNLDDVKQSLLAMPGDLVRECFPDALAAGGAVIERELRPRTPQAAEETTSAREYGRLVDDLSTHVEVDALEGTAKTGFGKLGHVALFEEYGHRKVSHTGKVVGFVPANPFMRQAAEVAADGAVDAFEESIKDKG
jgi:hypothetical protein